MKVIYLSTSKYVNEKKIRCCELGVLGWMLDVGCDDTSTCDLYFVYCLLCTQVPVLDHCLLRYGTV